MRLAYTSLMRLMIAILAVAFLVLVDGVWHRGYHLNRFADFLRWILSYMA